MQLYELFCVASGTVSDDEVKSIADAVQTALHSAGATDIEMKNLGKSRLAYPMNHIRYGYFLIYRFQASSQMISAITNTLRLSGGLLRFVIRKTIAGAERIERISPIADVLVRERDERPDALMAPVSAYDTTRQIHTVQPEPVMAIPEPSGKTETKAEDIKLDDIDKKLDEILGGDISNV